MIQDEFPIGYEVTANTLFNGGRSGKVIGYAKNDLNEDVLLIEFESRSVVKLHPNNTTDYFRGFHVNKLREIFSALTAHMRNWKESIDVYATEENKDLYAAAIIFHVGGTVDIVEIIEKNTATRFHLSSAGYYAIIGI